MAEPRCIYCNKKLIPRVVEETISVKGTYGGEYDGKTINAMHKMLAMKGNRMGDLFMVCPDCGYGERG